MAPKSATLLRGPDGLAHSQPPEDLWLKPWHSLGLPPVQRRGRPRAITPPVIAETRQMISRESAGHQRLTAQKNERTKAKVATGVREVVGEVQRAASEDVGAPRRRQPPRGGRDRWAHAVAGLLFRWPVDLTGRDRWAHTVAGPPSDLLLAEIHPLPGLSGSTGQDLNPLLMVRGRGCVRGLGLSESIVTDFLFERKSASSANRCSFPSAIFLILDRTRGDW